MDIRQIIQMLRNSQSGATPISQMNVAELKNQAMSGSTPYGQMNMAEMARMAQNPMEAVLSLPANEMQRNYADGQMPLYTGGLLQNQQGNMVDPQQLMNIAYDMSAPREMRINAIERLRALGIQ